MGFKRRESAFEVLVKSAGEPIVKWAGGKGRLVHQLAALRPKSYGHYFEPFFGGGALFFHLAPRRAILSDLNEDLMGMYRCLVNDVDAVIVHLEALRDRHSKEHYYEMRDRWNALKHLKEPWSVDSVGRAAAFIYLNKTCYNGLWRVNRAGLFNVPAGSYRNPRIFYPQRLRRAATILSYATVLETGSYDDFLSSARPSVADFIYFDPPYHPASPTANFTGYTPGGFGERDQIELAQAARDLAESGCHVMISNSDTPLIRALYSDFGKIHTVKVPRTIAAKSRGSARELIITSEYTPIA